MAVFEAQAAAGGLAGGFKARHWDWYLEKYYHHWFASDHDLKRWLRALNLASNLIYRQPSTMVYFQRRFYRFDSPLAVLKFPGLTLSVKSRFAAVTAYLKYVARWQSLEAVSASAWLTQHYGLKAYRAVWQPLLEGKFGPYSRQVNMAWMWARLKARTPSLGTYRGGFQTCSHDLVAALTRRGVTFHFNTPITRLKPHSQGLTLFSQSGSHRFDRVLLTTPPALTAKISPFLPSAYLKSLLEQPFLGAIMLILSLKQPLTHSYWYNLPKAAGFPFLALVEHTNFVSPRYFGGEHLVYCGDYLLPHHHRLKASPDQLLQAYLPGLQKLNPAFTPDWINQAWVFQTAYAQPVPGLNHSQKIPLLVTPHPHLFFAGLAHVYPWDRGTNYAVALGRRVAQLMLQSL